MSQPFPFDEALNRELSLAPLKGRDVRPDTRWEHKIVGLILKKFGLEAAGSKIAAASRSRAGQPGLKFVDFKAFFPDFPVWFHCQKIPYVHTTTVADLFRAFEKTKLFRAFVNAESLAPPEYQAGRLVLAFEWLHVLPVAVFHNYYADSSTYDESVLLRNWTLTHPPQRFALQSLSGFLDSLHWVP